ncbi:unnamed protein product [Lampetra fluviatilis]
MKGAGVANAPLRANDTEAAQPRLVSSPRGAELRSHPLEAAPFARTWIPRQHQRGASRACGLARGPTGPTAPRGAQRP